MKHKQQTNLKTLLCVRVCLHIKAYAYALIPPALLISHTLNILPHLYCILTRNVRFIYSMQLGDRVKKNIILTLSHQNSFEGLWHRFYMSLEMFQVG